VQLAQAFHLGTKLLYFQLQINESAIRTLLSLNRCRDAAQALFSYFFDPINIKRYFFTQLSYGLFDGLYFDFKRRNLLLDGQLDLIFELRELFLNLSIEFRKFILVKV